jgi:hypothetical protein
MEKERHEKINYLDITIHRRDKKLDFQYTENQHTKKL